RGFLPSTGRLVRYQPPAQSPARPPDGSETGVAGDRDHARPRGVPRAGGESGGDAAIIRVDDGVEEGGEVSMFYDPMIAKLITRAPTRIEAIDRQIEALDSFRIEGIGHNIDFLSALMQHPRFRAGNITTGFIAEEYPEGFTGAPPDPTLVADLAVIAALAGHEADRRAGSVSGQLNGRVPVPDERVVRLAGAEHRVRLRSTDGGML